MTIGSLFSLFSLMGFLKLFVGVALAVFASLSIAGAQDSAVPGLRAELEAMLVSDQLYRGGEWRTVAEKFGHNSAEMAAVVEKQHALDDANIRRLTEIVDSNGWPKRSVFGLKAVSVAAIVVQHAGLAHQQRFLPMLREAVAQGEAMPENLATLEDRVRMREGKPQLYGSQMTVDPVTRKHSFYQIDDEINVDQRRAAVGLGPLAEYAKRFGFAYEPPKP